MYMCMYILFMIISKDCPGVEFNNKRNRRKCCQLSETDVENAEKNMRVVKHNYRQEIIIKNITPEANTKASAKSISAQDRELFWLQYPELMGTFLVRNQFPDFF